MTVRRLEDVLSELLGVVVGPHRQRAVPDPTDPERLIRYPGPEETPGGTITDPAAAIRRL